MFLKHLIQAGCDPNTLNAEGKSIITQTGRSPEALLYLWEQGAKLIPENRHHSLLEFIISSLSHQDSDWQLKERWLLVLAKIMPQIDLKDFY